LQLFIAELNRAKTDSKDDGKLPPPDAGSGQTEAAKGPHPRGRRPLAPHVKRQRIEHDLRAEEKQCAGRWQDLQLFGEEASERYEYVPKQFIVIEEVCKNYACACTIRTATKPPQPIAKSSAGASLLAQVSVGKIADHVPLHRQGKIFSRLGVDIADQTMGGWMRQLGELLSPLYERLKTFVLSSKVAGTDDTPVRVPHKNWPGTTRTGPFLPYVGDRDHPGVVFDYTPTRERAGPEKVSLEFPGLFAGRCLCGLRQLFHRSAARLAGSSLLGALSGALDNAHARRKFVDAVKVNPEDGEAIKMVTRIDALFLIDRQAKEQQMSAAERLAFRQEHATPWVTEIHQECVALAKQALPKSALGQAVGYTLNQWEKLHRVFDHGEVELSNNLAENSMRPVALGRKNWPHVGSKEAGPKVAAVLSVIESCRRLGISARDYLLDVLSGMNRRKLSEVASVTPSRWSLNRA
jgi:transposase